MDLSIIIPVYNEEESLDELLEWIARVIKDQPIVYEVIMVDDGSSDRSWEKIEELSQSDHTLRAIRFRRNYGKAAALHSGFQAAEGRVVITMDADLQDSPDEIPELYRMISDGNWDLVSGWKKKRYDPITKKWPSKLFNWAARRYTGIRLHDFNCGLKAYTNELVKNIEVYGEMHRYIPLIAKQAGFTRIGEKVVVHQKRKYGVTKFGMERYIKGYLDLITILFISRFGKKPMHLFGTLGTLVFFVGFLAAAWLGGQKLYRLSQHIKTTLLTESPYFYLALTAMVIGTLLFIAGFLGELIARSSVERNRYQIDKII
jgi:glycosyltransferase involved in cell wall biosynthesis